MGIILVLDFGDPAFEFVSHGVATERTYYSSLTLTIWRRIPPTVEKVLLFRMSHTLYVDILEIE